LFSLQIIEIMIFILSKVPPRLSYDLPDPHAVDVESELQHTLLKAGLQPEHNLLCNPPILNVHSCAVLTARGPFQSGSPSSSASFQQIKK